MTVIPKTDTIEIRILSTQGCANTPPTISRIQEIAKELAVPIHIKNVLITTEEEAGRNRFFGSPTVQINGVDLDPEKRDSTTYGLAWRLYGASGVPSIEMIRGALMQGYRKTT